jgi:hypothetical protein
MSDATMPIEKDETVAEAFIDSELAKSRTHLQRTRIGVVAGVAIVGLYMGYVTNGFRENLEPKTAALITSSMVSQRMDEAEPQFAEFIRAKVPETIRGAPDYALARMPEYRLAIEEQVESDLRAHAKTSSVKLTEQLTVFLEAHRDQVEGMLLEPDKPAAAEAMGAGLEERFREFLAQQPIAGDTIQSRLDKTLKALTDVEKRVARLVANKGLTPSEQKTRRAIANLMRRIDAAKVASPEQVLDPSKISAAIKTMGG